MVSDFRSSFVFFPVSLTMPPKSKRRIAHEMNLEKAREAKRVCLSDVGESNSAVHVEETSREERLEPAGLADLLDLSVDALDTEDEAVDPSFDMDASIKSDNGHIMDNFCEERVTGLDWEDRAFPAKICL